MSESKTNRGGNLLAISALEGHTVDQGAGGMHPRPLQGRFAKPFLYAIFEYIAEPFPLHLGLVADDDSIVSPRPHRSFPANDPAYLASQVPLEVLHEARQLLLVLCDQEAMPMLCRAPSYVELPAPRAEIPRKERQIELSHST